MPQLYKDITDIIYGYIDDLNYVDVKKKINADILAHRYRFRTMPTIYCKNCGNASFNINRIQIGVNYFWISCGCYPRSNFFRYFDIMFGVGDIHHDRYNAITYRSQASNDSRT